ncbi:MAG: hypothetical protein KTR30_21550 [Saprospiraceae bacterium]|nr:hypothetical protein [Saprospiraceae bacterium]
MWKLSSCATFLKIAAVCSLLGATTTALLIFLPQTPAPDFEAQLLLHNNPLYLTKLWILFLHPQFNLIASLGLGLLLLKQRPWAIAIGSLFLTCWAYTELRQQAYLIDALNQLWRPAYLAETEEGRRHMYQTLIQGINGINDSHYFVVIYAFGMGSLLFGWSMIQEQNWGKWLGGGLIFIGLLSIASFGRYYLGAHFLNLPIDFSYRWIYPYLQPLVRIGIAVWIYERFLNIS